MTIRSSLRALLTVLTLLGTSALVGVVAVPGASADNTATHATTTPRIPGVYYQIQARHSGRCLDVQGASTADVAPVIQFHCIIRHSNQQWDLTRNSYGYYQIRVRHSGKCLDVEGASRADGARIIQYRCHGGANQQFQFLGDFA